MESLWDPGTHALLDELGVGTGWRCLEVGAGGGSLVQWMVSRCAHVTAIDIDTRFIEQLASDMIEVHRVDLRTDEIPHAQFDLVHARLVLEHLTDRRQILDRLAAALRPGGWIVVEDYDWSCFGFDEQGPGGDRASQAIIGFMEKAGFQRDYGRRIVPDLVDAGFVDVRGEGRARVISSRDPGFDFFRLSFESLRATVVAEGVLAEEDAAETSMRFDGDMRVFTPLMVAGIGRRP
ncbi:SAM-dependent methyltransferase [Mycobacteriaceae bacterium 1482268.1]|nr:SAM-dependent methyltransferase [Mycobacteriaceae bacterium 1482268.1]